MVVKNIGSKVIGFGSTVLLPGESGELPLGYDKTHRTVQFYLNRGFLTEMSTTDGIRTTTDGIRTTTDGIRTTTDGIRTDRSDRTTGSTGLANPSDNSNRKKPANDHRVRPEEIEIVQ